MERKKKACWNCFYYRAYYTKELCCFDKQKVGFCRIHKKITENQEECVLWTKNNPYRARRKIISMRKLDTILDNIIEIRQILFESNEEDKTDSEK